MDVSRRQGWLALPDGRVERRRQPIFPHSRHGPCLAIRRRRCRAIGARYLHVVVPEKLSLYDDRFDGLAVDARLSPARRLAARLRWSWSGRRTLIDLVGPMRASRDLDPPLHYRTDTHWNVHGCLLAYRLVCRACGATPRGDLLDRPRTVFSAVLDIGAKLDDPPLETVHLYDLRRDAERVAGGAVIDAYAAAGRLGDLHTGSHAVYRNASPDADPRRIVLFGDSCANFSANGLTAMLAETFREVHFIWSTNLDWSYLERVRPDLVLFEMVERFMPRVPEDDFDVAAAQTEKLAALSAALEAQPPG
jgi:alginate O-acetyltransferase complex protein AlgJ